MAWRIKSSCLAWSKHIEICEKFSHERYVHPREIRISRFIIRNPIHDCAMTIPYSYNVTWPGHWNISIILYKTDDLDWLSMRSSFWYDFEHHISDNSTSYGTNGVIKKNKKLIAPWFNVLVSHFRMICHCRAQSWPPFGRTCCGQPKQYGVVWMLLAMPRHQSRWWLGPAHGMLSGVAFCKIGYWGGCSGTILNGLHIV